MGSLSFRAEESTGVKGRSRETGSNPGEEEVKEVIQVKGRKRDKRRGPAVILVKDGVLQKGGGSEGLALF